MIIKVFWRSSAKALCFHTRPTFLVPCCMWLLFSSPKVLNGIHHESSSTGVCGAACCRVTTEFYLRFRVSNSGFISNCQFFFYWHVSTHLLGSPFPFQHDFTNRLEHQLIRDLRVADPQLSHSSAMATVQAWLKEDAGVSCTDPRAVELLQDAWTENRTCCGRSGLVAATW